MWWGQGSRTIGFCSISISVGVCGEGDSAVICLYHFLKSLTFPGQRFGRRNGKRLQCGFSSHCHFPEIPKLLFRTVLALWDPLIIATGAFTQCVPVSADGTWKETNGP